MNTKAQVFKEYPEYKTIINAVVNRIGMESINDVNNYGIDGGFNGFIYYVDTHKFAMKHRKDIIKLLENLAEGMESDAIKTVSEFGFFRKSPMDNEDRKELYKYLGGGKCEQSTITNLMAWFAAEEVCRMFDN